MDPSELDAEPWSELESLVEAANREEMEGFLDALPASETARAISRLSDENQTELLSKLLPEDAADVIGQLPEVQAAGLVEGLSAQTAAGILEEMPSDQRADIIGDLTDSQAESILSEMVTGTAEEIRSLVRYDDDQAGGLMVKEFLAYPSEFTVTRVINDLRTNADTYRDYQIQYAYVTDNAGRLVGVLRLRDLLLAAAETMIAGIMVSDPATIGDASGLDELRDFFDEHRFFGAPVVDSAGAIVGVVRRAAVEEALAERNADDFLKTQGVIQEELRTMPVLLRSRRRLAWLSINIGLNVLAASVIAVYQETLTQVIALAVFLPIISDMSGCSGNQAVAVSMRELSLGLVRPNEVLRVWLKEASVGLINGITLGLLIAVVAWVWQGNAWLGLVVGSAMALNTLIAVSLGGTLPLVMRKMKMDPALASGPILTTVTDMCGFFLILSLASALLPKLIGS